MDIPGKVMATFFVICNDGESFFSKTNDSYGEVEYNFITDPIAAQNDKNIKCVQAKKLLDCDVLKLQDCFICKVPGFQEFSNSLIWSIDEYSERIQLNTENEMKQLNIKDKVVVFKKIDGLFVQPGIFTQNLKSPRFLCFDGSCSDICGAPVLHKVKFIGRKVSPLSLNETFKQNPVRIVLRSNYENEFEFLVASNFFEPSDIENNRKIIKDIVSKFQWSKYIVQNGKSTDYLLSEPIDEIWEIVKNFGAITMTLLKIESQPAEIPYNFEAMFSGWYKIVSPFICFIHGLAKVSETLISGRIVHLSQSSGHGKTRLCLELLKYELRGIYCVYRAAGSTGFPRTTIWMSGLIDEFKRSNTNARSMHICAQFVKHAIHSFGSYGLEVIDKFENGTNEHNFTYEKVDCEHNNSFKTVCDSIKDCNRLFTFIFDECHELLINSPNNPDGLTLYRSLRRVFFYLKTKPLVAVFLGTKSSLNDFVLSAKVDPSLRKPVDKSEEGFDVPLYVYTQGVDAMMNKTFLLSYKNVYCPVKIGNSILSISKVMKDVSMCFGRPLWNQYGSFEEAFEVAKIKLNTEASLYELTCLILRTGSSVVPQDELAHKLVLSGMATLFHVDVNGSRCWTEYVPEPMLSNAARIVLTDIKLLEKALKDYVKRLQMGTFHDLGTSGELVARIVLLRAMDLSVLKRFDITEISLIHKCDVEILLDENLLTASASSSREVLNILNNITERNAGPNINSAIVSRSICISPKIGVVKLWEFLLMLSGIDYSEVSNFNIPDSVLEGVMSLNQFVQADGPLSLNQAYLMHCFARGCGLILPPRTKGIDLIIPVLRTDNLMSCIVIQVKNYDTEKFPSNKAEVMSKLSRKYLDFFDFGPIGEFKKGPDDEFIRIVMQFSDIQVSDSDPHSDPISKGYCWLPIPGSNRNGSSLNALWLLGIRKFYHLFFNNENILNSLELILSGLRNFLNTVDFPQVHLPSRLQSTRLGSELLARSGRSLNNFENILINDAAVRESMISFYENTLEDLVRLNLPLFSDEHKLTASLTPNEESQLLNATATSNEPVEWKNEVQRLIAEDERLNYIYSTKQKQSILEDAQYEEDSQKIKKEATFKKQFASKLNLKDPKSSSQKRRRENL